MLNDLRVSRSRLTSAISRAIYMQIVTCHICSGPWVVHWGVDTVPEGGLNGWCGLGPQGVGREWAQMCSQKPFWIPGTMAPLGAPFRPCLEAQCGTWGLVSAPLEPLASRGRERLGPHSHINGACEGRWGPQSRAHRLGTSHVGPWLCPITRYPTTSAAPRHVHAGCYRPHLTQF